MLKIAICDDCADDRAPLRDFLSAWLTREGHAHSISEYTSARPLMDDYAEGAADFDLLFLDIFMPETNGMEAARAIRRAESNVPIIFLTTTPDYALEGYDVRAFGYLVKPLDTQKAAALLLWFLKTEFSGGGKTMLLREGVRGKRIAYREILYVESRDALAIVHTSDGEAHRVYRKLDEIESELDGRSFLRCHKSYLVNLARVTAAEKAAFITDVGHYVPIRQRDAKAMREAYYQYLLQQAALTRL